MIKLFAINGVDYSLFVIGGGAVVIFFAAQLALCFKTRKMWVKLIPVYFIGLLLVLAVLAVTIGDSSDSFMDLSGLVAIVILCFALLLGFPVGAAWVIYRMRNNK
jgi:hypothetical protein